MVTNHQELDMGLDFQGFQVMNAKNNDPLSRTFQPNHKRSSMNSTTKPLSSLSANDLPFTINFDSPTTDYNKQSFVTKIGQFQNFSNLQTSPQSYQDSTSTFFVSESDEDSKRANTDSDSDDFEEANTYLSQAEIHDLNKMQIDFQFLREQNSSLARELACAKMTAQALRSIIQQKEEQIQQLSQDFPPSLLASIQAVDSSQDLSPETTLYQLPSQPTPTKSKSKSSKSSSSKSDQTSSDSSSVTSRLRLPFKIRGISGNSKPHS